MNNFTSTHPSELGTRKLCIFGTGGFARESLLVWIDSLVDSGYDYREYVVFMENDDDFDASEIMGIPVIRQSSYLASEHLLIVAVGDPASRKNIIDQFPVDTEYASLIHPTAVMSDWVEFGHGAIVTAGTIVTCNVKLGNHAQLNLHTTIGHDCAIGDFFTTAPGAKISGNCNFGDKVYIATNAGVRQGIDITSDVTIGMGAQVVKRIDSPGVYVGSPAKQLKQ